MRSLLKWACFLSVSLLALNGVAKDLTSRLGVGLMDVHPVSIPSLALRYHPNSEVGLFGAVGVDTLDQNSRFALALGLLRTIFKEDQLNFYAGGRFSLLTVETPAQKNSGYELAALLGTEFFFTGLENLGFNFETGVSVTNLDKVRFRTLADSPLRAGITFYF